LGCKGPHCADIDLPPEVLHRLTDQGNCVVAIEHKLDVIKTADWCIGLGPEGGACIVVPTPETINPPGWTAFLC